MKKILSLILAVLLLASLGVTAFAAEEKTESFDEVGITLTWPEAYDGLKGSIYPYPYGVVSYEPELCYMRVLYFAVPAEIFEKALEGKELTDEETAVMQRGQGELAEVYVSEVDLDTLARELEEGVTPEELGMVQFGEADGRYFIYCPMKNEEYLKAIGEDYAGEFLALQDSFLEVLKGAKLYAPVDPAAQMAGKTFRFETVDLDGNKVTSEELFAGNEVTMINYWGTWCGPCLGELTELGRMHGRLAEKGCGIIGIVEDADAADEASLQQVKDILKENGVGYTNIVPCGEMNEILEDVTAFPTSFFVDKTGKILCTPVVGAAVSEYEKVIDTLLAGGEAVSVPESADAQQNGMECYRVLVYDMDGNPVKGATIQFCSDDACNLGKTDAEGVAVFDMDEGLEYTVHVLKVPEGYAKNTTEYKTQTVYSDVTVFLEKDG